MVRNTWSREWELSGGSIDDGETPRETAVRCFAEETGMTATDVDYVGVATVQLGHERRIEYVAVYRTALGPDPVVGTGDKLKQVGWWDGVSEMPGLSPIDAHLGLLAVGRLPDGG
jgi:8-oxo-dGTP pyrophosphatase MutT (NUDIX family)